MEMARGGREDPKPKKLAGTGLDMLSEDVNAPKIESSKRAGEFHGGKMSKRFEITKEPRLRDH